MKPGEVTKTGIFTKKTSQPALIFTFNGAENQKQDKNDCETDSCFSSALPLKTFWEKTKVIYLNTAKILNLMKRWNLEVGPVI